MLVAAPCLAAPLDSARLSRLFGFDGTRPDAVTPLGPSTPLPFRLLGTLRAVDETWSLAAVEFEKRSVTVSIGDLLAGVEIVGIDQRELVVRRAGRLERLGPVAVAPRSPLPPRLTRRDVTRALENPAEIFSQVRMMPAMAGGKISGFRATWVQEGSLIATLGLEAGDVIRGVNGAALDNPQQLMVLLQAVQTGRRFEVELERKGQRVVKTVELGD
jgi:general secretion pathway protein C